MVRAAVSYRLARCPYRGGVETPVNRRANALVIGFALGVLLFGGLLAFPHGVLLAEHQCDVSWAAAADGNWNDGANWTGGVRPTSTQHACIVENGDYTVTIDREQSVGSLRLGGATGTQTLRLESNGSFGSVSFSIADGFTNGSQGVVELTSTAALAVAMNVAAGTLTNAGTIQSQVGAGGARTINASIANTGSLLINATTTLSNSGRTFTSTNGTINAAAAATLIVDQGTVNLGGGTTLPGGGAMNLRGVTLNLASDFTDPAAGTGTQVTFTNGSSTINGPGVFSNAGTLDVTDETFNSPYTNLSGATTTVHSGDTRFNGTLSNLANAMLRLEGDVCFNAARVFVANSFTNDGTIELTDVNNPCGAVLTINSVSGTLTNNGTIQTQVGAGGAHIINAQITNTGSMLINANTTLTNTNRTFTTTSGTVDVAAARTLIVDQGTVNLGGGTALLGSGTMNLRAVILNLASDFTDPAAGTGTQVTFTNGNSTINGPGVFSNAGILDVTDETFFAPYITLSGATTITRSGDTAVQWRAE